MIIGDIPEELTKYKQWVAWRYEVRDNKPTKVPYTLAGKRASSTNPKTWTDIDTIRSSSLDDFDGIGFVFTTLDPFIGIDWDNDPCLVGGEVEQFNSYAELSPSGRGVHCICKGTIPTGSRCRSGNREIYSNGRFFTFTGNHLGYTPFKINEAPKTVIEAFLQRLDQDAHKSPKSTTKSAGSPLLPFKSHAVTKDELKKVYDACKKGKYGTSFRKLFFDGNTSGYHSHSEADYALCYIIARVTNNPAIVDIIFRSSKLFRQKWNNNYYRQRTLDMAMTNALTASIEEMIEE